MKLAVILYHQNVQNYRPEWIKKCVKSIQNQTYKEFDVFEIDYGNTNTQIYPNSNFSSHELPSHAHAHNFLLDQVFSLGYDYAANCNVDDDYALNRLEKQLVYMQQGHDVISSNFYNIDEEDRMLDNMRMSDLNIIEEANKGHNIIAHPVVCYSKNFWTTCSRLNPEQIPLDDFELWKRSFEKYKFIICPEFLLYYRIHSKKVSSPKKDEQDNRRVSSWDEGCIRPEEIKNRELSKEEKEEADRIHNEWVAERIRKSK
ncbi:MAG: hypothetical protein AABY22_10110 [Nanoarchaeota archaeon]